MFLLVAALQTQSVTAMCGVLALFSCQLALCNPSKLGSIPDLVTVERIPAANAAIALAMVLGLIVGNYYVGALFDYTFPGAAIPSGRGTLSGGNWDRMLTVFGIVSVAASWLRFASVACRPPIAPPKFRGTW